MSTNPINSWVERQSGDITIRPNDHRDAYQRDKARILHSAAFRRLQSKTQILSVGEDDFYRTRLTHSLEVAQIGSGIMAQIRQLPNIKDNPQLQKLVSSDALIEALCLAHDIGHPPFGHGGEIALNYMMREHGGFEANGQTFRIITKLEPYTKNHGMDLTRRTILGLIKYPQLIQPSDNTFQTKDSNRFIRAQQWKPIKGLFLEDQECFDWVLRPMDKDDRTLFCQTHVIDIETPCFVNSKTQYKSFDASIMELADDIAYGVHDLEDAIVLGKVEYERWTKEVLPTLLKIDNPWANKHGEQLSEMLFNQEHFQRKNAIGALVNHLITNIEVKENKQFKSPLLRCNAKLNEGAAPVLEALKKFVFDHVIQETNLQRLEFSGQNMLIDMFEAFQCDPQRLLPKQVFLQYQEQDQNTRIICDYIANMSDKHAQRLYLQLFK